MESSKHELEDQHQLVLENLNYADKISRQFYEERSHLGLELDEYLAAGRSGLCDAAQRYDAAKGGSFGISRSHYYHLRPDDKAAGHALCTEVNEPAERKLPYALAGSSNDLLAMSSIIEEYGIRLHAKTMSGKISIGYAQAPNPEDSVCEVSGQRYLKTLINQLPLNQRRVIERRYYQDESFDEMCSKLGDLSKSWVSRLHAKAIKGLRQMIETDQARCSQNCRDYALSAEPACEALSHA